MTDKVRESLRAFAEKNPRRGRCKVCQLDVRDILDEEVRNGMPYSAVKDWLRTPVEQGGAGHPEISAAMVRHHFESGRHHDLP